MMFAAQKIRKQLEMFAKFKPNAIAQFLYDRGIKGYRDPDCCPLAVYLSQEVKASVKVLNTYSVCNGKQINNPHNVSTFITRFDNGYYKFLCSKT